MIFWYLLRTDLELLLGNLKDKAMNAIIWTVCTVVIAGYVFQKYGISKDYGMFQSASVVVGAIGFELYAQMFILLADIEGDNHLSYYFTVPISNWLIFLKLGVLYTVNGMILGLISIPVIKLVLPYQFHLAQVSWGYLMLSLVVTNIFFAAFTLFLTGFTSRISKIDNIIMRILFPLWFLGCFQFSYKIACQLSPLFGYLTLISPYTYATEAFRASMLDPSQYLPVWLCNAVLILMSLAVGVLGLRKLKSRLDFV